MIVGLDTSIVIRLLAGEPPEQARVAFQYLADRRRAGDRVLVSDLVVSESYYALQHHYGASKGDTLAALKDFLATAGVECIGEALAVLQTPGLATAKPGFIDRVIERGYRRFEVDTFVTFERSGARLSGVVVLIP